MFMGLALGADPGSAGEIANRLDQLRSPVRVLYVAAHPDDENTQLLTWLARGLRVRAGYLSLTRGDGGQNLIGPEQRPFLGIIRTHELLAARSLDGTEQWFTRLRDFGYSKSADESLTRWGEAEALSEVVRVYRTFRPHVVITRFPEEGRTHGHHLASAQLARRAIALAADERAFEDQLLAGLDTWKVRRLFYNFPHFWAKRGMQPPPGKTFQVDVGGYGPWQGLSFGEISARARSMHKSQGFGASARHGPWLETLVLLEGFVEGDDPFGGLPIWDDLPGGAKLHEDLEAARRSFDGRKPSAIVPWLGRAHYDANEIQDPRLRKEVQDELRDLMVLATGLFLEARSERAEAFPGEQLTLNLRALVRCPGGTVVLRNVKGPDMENLTRTSLDPSKPWVLEGVKVKIPEAAQPTQPHWLSMEPGAFRYELPEPSNSVLPKLPGPLQMTFEVGIGGVGLDIAVPATFHWVDPVHGERIQEVEIGSAVSATPAQEVVLAPNGRGTLSVRMRAGERPWSGLVRFRSVGAPIVVRPEAVPLTLKAGESRTVRVVMTGKVSGRVELEVADEEGLVQRAWTRTQLDYPHIPVSTVRRPSGVLFRPVVLKLPDRVVGYVPGSGDAVADTLASVGMKVQTLDGPTLRAGKYGGIDTILTGIRAFNVNEDLLAARDRIMEWVKAGGTLVVQYNTKNWSSALEVEIGPYPLQIGRGRVTDEGAPVAMRVPDHTLLQFPHELTSADFEGWVQERGLYFAETWDDHYVPLFSVADPGEEAQSGSTLFARYGRGAYVFTGLSLFRQLPAGHPGALRLLVNFLSARAAKDAP